GRHRVPHGRRDRRGRSPVRRNRHLESPRVSNASFQGAWEARFGRPEPKILCIGLNYRAHTAESGVEQPDERIVFAEFASAVIEDGDAIVVPPGVGHVDSEAELAVVIGTAGHRIAVSDAYAHVAGYTCANDVSARDIQVGDGQWFRGK